MCSQRGDQHGHVLTPLHPPESFGRFQHTGSDPAEHHRPPAPAFHVPLHVACPAQEALDGTVKLTSLDQDEAN